MKRMYVVLGLMFVLVFGVGSLFGQRPVDDEQMDSLKKRMRMREEMHRRMMEKLLKGKGSDQDLFSDMEKFMDEIMTDSFNGLSSFSRTTSENYKIDWTESKSGRTLVITPDSPDQKLDINVSNGFIEIKGKKEHKISNGTFYSNFANSFNVPGDCDATKVKMEQKDGKILMHFPYRVVKAVDIKPKEDRIPVAPSESDVQI
jgi:HSP20 family molecular chaperone IbpA